jgi:hypothetical protein
VKLSSELTGIERIRSMSCCASVACTERALFLAATPWAPSMPLRIPAVATASTTQPTSTSISAEPRSARSRERPAAQAAAQRARRRAGQERLSGSIDRTRP